jgi:hypothetical protein
MKPEVYEIELANNVLIHPWNPPFAKSAKDGAPRLLAGLSAYFFRC